MPLSVHCRTWAPLPLTTIDMDLGKIGRIAALKLLAQIDPGTPGEAGAITVACRLIVRESA